MKCRFSLRTLLIAVPITGLVVAIGMAVVRKASCNADFQIDARGLITHFDVVGLEARLIDVALVDEATQTELWKLHFRTGVASGDVEIGHAVDTETGTVTGGCSVADIRNRGHVAVIFRGRCVGLAPEVRFWQTTYRLDVGDQPEVVEKTIDFY